MRCPYCGAKKQADLQVCSSCGRLIEIPASRRRKKVVISSLVIAVVGIAIMVFFYMSFAKVGPFADKEQTPFGDYSWEELAKISSDMSIEGSRDGALRIADRYGFVGEDGDLKPDLVKEFELSDGTQLQARLVDVYHDPRTNGGGPCGMSFAIVGMQTPSSINAQASNAGGWEKSALREWANGEFYNSLPDDLHRMIFSVRKSTNNVGQTNDPSSVSITDDLLWPFSYVEFFGQEGMPASGEAVLSAEGTEYELLTNSEVRATLLGDLARDGEGQWWLRSPVPSTASDYFTVLTANNNQEGSAANTSQALVLGFAF